MNLIGSDALRDDTSGGRYATFRHNDARRKKCFSSNPGTVCEFDWPGLQPKGRIGPIMVAGAQIGALRDANVIADPYGGEIIDPAALAEPNVVSHIKMPRVFDPHARLNDDARSHLSAKRSEYVYPDR
jgi:hypothetical protein